VTAEPRAGNFNSIQATLPLLENSNRIIVELLDQQFDRLIESLRALTESTPSNLLYKQNAAPSIGENILKSAGVIEQTFGGITANLWDDAFEWTLPETLSTDARVLEYLAEVKNLKNRAFVSFMDDGMLLKLVSLPSGESCHLLELLLTTMLRASDYRGRAAATLKLLSSEDGTRFII
jgi:hypothetical protein